MQAVILSGGVGSRLWPRSTSTSPKPFMVMEDGESLLQKTYVRASSLGSDIGIITVVNHALAAMAQKECLKINCLNKTQLDFILEPEGKNTAAAIASSALHVQKIYGGDELMLILPADHIIADQDAFNASVNEAKKLALEGKIVTFGVKPERAETGYGYIEAEGQTVKRFVEKPTLEKAEEYLQNPNFLWNSGMFLFKAKVVIAEMQKHCPKIFKACKASYIRSSQSNVVGLWQHWLEASEFEKVPENSIDYALMEKSDNLAVLHCDFGWRDIGNWDSVSNISGSDGDGNKVKGEAILYNVSDCYIESSSGLVGAVGVKNLAIIKTDNGILVTDKQNSEQVKKLYAKIQDNEPKTRNYSWGNIRRKKTDISNLKTTQIEILPGQKMLIRNYFSSSCNFIVVQGVISFKQGKRGDTLRAGKSKYLHAADGCMLINTSHDLAILAIVEIDDILSKDVMIAS